MGKVITFNEAQKNQIRLTLEDRLQITDPAQQNRFITSIEQTGKLRIFGYGSLLTYSHLQNSDRTFKDIEKLKSFAGLDIERLAKELGAPMPSTLKGFKRDFVCFDTFYRGTKEKPAITLGMDRSNDDETPGGILDISLEGMDPNVIANFIEYNFKEFAEREIPPDMPIYKFSFENVDVTNRDAVMALVCIADDQGPLYIYNPENEYVKKDPIKYNFTRDNPEKVHGVMSTAMGYPYKKDPQTGCLVEKTKGSVTCMDYVRNFIEDSLKNKIPVHPVYYATYANMMFERMKAQPEELRILHKHEREGELANTPDIATKLLIAIGGHNARLQAENDNGQTFEPEKIILDNMG